MTCEFEQLNAAKTTEALTELYDAWLLANEFPGMCAHELQAEMRAVRDMGEHSKFITHASDDQIAYVCEFIDCWEIAQTKEDAS